MLLILFAAGHTLGFRKIQPQWGIDALVASMQSMQFDAQGFTRCYWDFYVGFGLFVSIFLLFAGVLCWQLGGLSAQILRSLAGICWTLALSFAVITFLSWKYFFVAPVVFAILITSCLFLAAGLAVRAT